MTFEWADAVTGSDGAEDETMICEDCGELYNADAGHDCEDGDE